ncbi:MAG: sugar transferase [Bacteroidetes bacterium]|nr:sugar transferase [Bacteroidota bacterium]
MIRFLDLLISFFGLILFSPILVIVSICIIIDSKLPVFYTQCRVGKNNRDFNVVKFRTMKTDNESNFFLTAKENASRITKVGAFLRKSKLDELPQLINVLKGEMSIVGPRPEVRKYVNMYSEEQKEILKARPGITDYAAIKYFNEEAILANSDNPEQLYITKILPEKILLNKLYINNISVKEYLKIIFITLNCIFRQGMGETKS